MKVPEVTLILQGERYLGGQSIRVPHGFKNQVYQVITMRRRCLPSWTYLSLLKATLYKKKHQSDGQEPNNFIRDV